MALLGPHAGDLSGAESPPQGSHLDGTAGWSRGGSFGGVGSTLAAGAGALAPPPPPTLPPISLPLPPPLSRLAAHQISVGEELEGGSEPDRAPSDSDDSDDDSGATSASSVFTLCNSAIGAGVLSLPFAFRRAGLGGGLALCVAVGSVEAFTLYVISKFAERYEARSYGQLVRRALGKKLAITLRLVLSIYLCGSCVAYMVIIGDCFTPLLSGVFVALGGGGGGGGGGGDIGGGSGFGGGGGFGGGRLPPFSPSPSAAAAAAAPPAPAPLPLVDRARVIWAAAALVAYPLCLPRTLGALARVSAAAVAGFAFTAAAVVARGLEAVAARGRHHKWDGMTRGVRGDYGALFAIPIVVFGFNCHANVVSVFTELERHPEVFGLPSSPAAFASWAATLPSLVPVPPAPRTRKLIGMLGVIATAVAVIACGYMSVGVAGYAAFPLTVGGNVLNSFSEDDRLMQTVRGVVGGVVLAHYPLNHHPARAAAEDIYRSVTKRRASPLGSALGSALFVALSAAVAVAVPDLGSVLHLIGGTAAAFIILFLPGLLLINAAIVKHTAAESSAAAGSFADLRALVEGGTVLGEEGEGDGGAGGGAGAGGGGLRASLLSSAAATAAAARRRAAARRARRAAVAAARKASAAAAAATAASGSASPLRVAPDAARACGGGGGDAGFELGGEGLGIKKVGLIYSPRKSWWAGVALVALAVGIWIVTILTAIVPYRE